MEAEEVAVLVATDGGAPCKLIVSPGERKPVTSMHSFSDNRCRVYSAATVHCCSSPRAGHVMSPQPWGRAGGGLGARLRGGQHDGVAGATGEGADHDLLGGRDRRLRRPQVPFRTGAHPACYIR